MRLAEFGVNRQVDLSPTPIHPEFPNPLPQPDSDVACHLSIVRLFSDDFVYLIWPLSMV
jgi:hypothetical protein